MTIGFAGNRRHLAGLALAAAIVLLYLLRLNADSIGGLFGILLCDEGTYLLAAKNQALFGTAHFFEGDIFRPELIVPLAHHYALLTITAAEPVLWMRLGVALLVLSGMALLSWLAGKYHRNNTDALLCFLCLLLNPVLFFYARSGLSEGLQFFLLAIVLALLFRLHGCGRLKEAVAISCTIGALTAVLFLAKISAVTACIGIGAGLLATLFANPALTRKPMLAALALMSGLIVLLLYGILLGDNLPEWVHTNILTHAGPQLPSDADNALRKSLLRWPYLAYFLSLMPIFILYLPSLLIAADKKRGFVFILCIVALAVIAAETVFTGSDSIGSIRRNFFGLSMLSIVAGFTCREFMEKGIAISFRQAPLAIVSTIFIAAYLSGPAFLLRWAIQHDDTTYIVFCSLFLLIALIAFVSTFNARLATPRCLLALLAALAVLIPMVFQAFFAPRTREEIVAAMENYVPPDAFIIGSTAPWFLQGLHRKMIFNNCLDDFHHIVYANDINKVPVQGKIYLMSLFPMWKDPCPPADTHNYTPTAQFRLFLPQNYGGLYGVSGKWVYTVGLYLYEKQ